jgi:RND family efflux transporter MFP subunit
MRMNILRTFAFLYCAAAAAQDGVWVAGLTEPFKDVVLSAHVPGLVAARLAREGDAVTNGQVLVELDKRMEELSVQRRKLVADQLRVIYQGDRFLFTNSPAPSLTSEDLAKAEVEYRVAVLDAEMAAEELAKRLIRAPMDGYVTDIFVQPGEERKAQDPVLRMAETRQCYFVSNVEAKTGWNLKTGQTVQLQIETGPGLAPVQGTVVFVSPVVDPASGLMRVKVLFSNLDGKIRPGVAGKMRLEGVANGK